MAGYSVTNQWTNPDGLTVSLTPSAWPEVVPKEVVGNPLHAIVMHVDLTTLSTQFAYPRDLDNDGETDGFSLEDFHFETGDILVDAMVIVGGTAAAGGTALAVGVFETDGTAIDANGIITQTEAATADLTANTVISGAGDLLGTKLTQDAYPVAYVYGTFTAGEVDVVITYLRFPS